MSLIDYSYGEVELLIGAGINEWEEYCVTENEWVSNERLVCGRSVQLGSLSFAVPNILLHYYTRRVNSVYAVTVGLGRSSIRDSTAGWCLVGFYITTTTFAATTADGCLVGWLYYH